MTALHDAVEMGSIEHVRKLLSPSNVNSKVAGWTPLHLTVFQDLPQIAEYVLTHGADVNATGRDDETPLHTASCRRRYELARILLTHGADVNSRDASGKTPLDCALSEHDDEMVALLRRRE